MGITRRCDYACRIIRAAYQSDGAYVSIADVAERECIPYSFARSIQHDLVKAGILRTNRGVHGGLTLSCDPDTTTLLDVLNSMRAEVSVAECTCPEHICVHKQTCSFNAVWCAADALVERLYGSITLTELFEQGGDHPAVRAAFAAADQ